MNPEPKQLMHKNKTETNGQTTGAELIPQPHGGALQRGRPVGHPGAGGRPRSEVQAKLRGPLTDELIEVIRQIGLAPRQAPVPVECPQCGHKHTVTCDNPPAGDADRLRAGDIVLKYGTGTPSNEDHGPTVILSLERPPEYREP